MKKIVLKSLAADLAKERDGEWVKSRRFEGSSYHVRSVNNPEYRAEQASSLRSLQETYASTNSEVDVNDLQKARAKLMVSHIIIGWNGFDEEYTADLGREILSDPAYRDLLADIEDCASRVGRRQVERVEADAKN
jgi:hypothetical protein